MTMPHNARVTAVTLNSPNPPALARFYAQLLDWTIDVQSEGWVTLPNPNGGVKLAFHIEDVYTPPVWPSQPGEQIIMEHVDIQVDDLAEACAHAKACGARMAEYQPQDDVRVHFDPDGHIFCLYLAE